MIRHPRPWRMSDRPMFVNGIEERYPVIEDADGEEIDLEVRAGDLIVRLVNAEPEIVAALEGAERALLVASRTIDAYGERLCCETMLAHVREVLAKVRPSSHLRGCRSFDGPGLSCDCWCATCDGPSVDCPDLEQASHVYGPPPPGPEIKSVRLSDYVNVWITVDHAFDLSDDD